MDNSAINNVQTETLQNIGKLQKEHGTLKAIGLQLIRYFPYYISIIIIGLFSIFQFKNDKRLEQIEQKININNNNNTNVLISNAEANDTKSKQTVTTSTPTTLGNNTEFNPDGWIIESMDIDKEGYYCPLVKNFNFWSMWTKDKFPVEFKSAKIRVKIKPYKNKKVIPTIVISYGEYVKNFSPSIFYSLNLFDEDTKTLRLYDNKNDSVSQDWLKELPDITNEMIITIQPRVPSPNERKIVINPQITYPIIDSGKQTDFKPNVEFSTLLPTVNLEDSNLKKQIGIGTRFGMCIKPISVDIEL